MKDGEGVRGRKRKCERKRVGKMGRKRERERGRVGEGREKGYVKRREKEGGGNTEGEREKNRGKKE